MEIAITSQIPPPSQWEAWCDYYAPLNHRLADLLLAAGFATDDPWHPGMARIWQHPQIAGQIVLHWDCMSYRVPLVNPALGWRELVYDPDLPEQTARFEALIYGLTGTRQS